MMRSELFEAVKDRLQEAVPEVQHIDLWNHNVEFIEQEDNWARPAVFIEIDTIGWSPVVGGGFRGHGVVKVHLVTDWSEGGHEAAFALSEKVRKALDGLAGDCFGGFALLETSTNHNHEDILESIESYAVRYTLYP